MAPALFSASIYMIQRRIVLLTGGERLSLIRVGWLTKIFVVGDVFSFLLQCAGMSVSFFPSSYYSHIEPA